MPEEENVSTNSITSYQAHDNTKHSITDELKKLILARDGDVTGVKNIADAVRVLTELETGSGNAGLLDPDAGVVDGNDSGT